MADAYLSEALDTAANQYAALERLIKIAKGDTGQSRRVADFLLAWWNPGTCGGFDLTNLWAVDQSIADDMQAVFGLIARAHCYADAFGLGPDFKLIVEAWRPELCGQQGKPRARGAR